MRNDHVCSYSSCKEKSVGSYEIVLVNKIFGFGSQQTLNPKPNNLLAKQTNNKDFALIDPKPLAPFIMGFTQKKKERIMSLFASFASTKELTSYCTSLAFKI